MSDCNLKITKRHLPHWDIEESVYFVTFDTKAKIFSVNEIEIILTHIIEGNEKYYFIFAAVVMPDHVHIIYRAIKNYSLSRILKGIKGASARKINKLNNTKGSIWQSESFDRIIRDEADFNEKLNYILNNPLKKGIIDNPYNYKGLFINNDMLT